MTKEEKFRLIQEWQSAIARTDAVMDRLNALVGCQPEASLQDAIYRLQDAFTNATAALVGDDGEWLQWWRFECKFGETPLGATIGDGEKLQLIDSLEKLLDLIDA